MNCTTPSFMPSLCDCPKLIVCDGYKVKDKNKFRSGQITPERAAAYIEFKRRLRALAGTRMTKDGVIVISANRFRSQERNREDALERLLELLRSADTVPRRRQATRPSRAAKERRLWAKKQRSSLKKTRSHARDFD